MHPNPRSENDRSMGLQEARKHYARGLLSQYESFEDPHAFSTYSRTDLIRFFIDRLRWIECAPEGAWFTVAPMQDKRGVPCGLDYRENLGPSKALRAARVRHGRDPRNMIPFAV